MATVITAPGPRPTKRHSFAPNHRWDHNFFLLYVGLIWLGVLAGFVPEIAKHLASSEAPFAHVVHVHGAVMVSWLGLLTTQVLLIRNRRLRFHKRLGIAGAILAGMLVILGLATALTVHKLHLNTPSSDPAFFSIELIDMTAFGALVAAAIGARKLPAAHKRLILLATLGIADAGFARWLGDSLHFGDGVLAFMVQLFLPTDLLIAGIGIYDWLTRRRLHPAYVAGAALILSGQLTASWLYHSPGWKALATNIVLLWPWA